MTKQEEPCIGFFKMFNKLKSFAAGNQRSRITPYISALTTTDCFRSYGTTAKKINNKKKDPDEIVPAATQRRKDNLLASMPGDYIMSTFGCQVTTSCRRLYDVISTSCACFG